MINQSIQEHPIHGKCLFADNGVIEIGIPLTFGLRVCHLSLCGGGNLFFEQPHDLTSFMTEEGWRLRGGHRFWLAPEGKATYYPDNDPIRYDISGDSITVVQPEDPWLKVIKSMVIRFEDNRIRICHKIINTGDEPLVCSLWGISCMAPGGVETIHLKHRDGGYDPLHNICMWDYTSMGDPRAHYERDRIVLTYLPIDAKYKIGVGHPISPVRYENKGVAFIKHFTVHAEKPYPDCNVSYETYFNKYFVEIESLSPMAEAAPGEGLTHEELWELKEIT